MESRTMVCSCRSVQRLSLCPVREITLRFQRIVSREEDIDENHVTQSAVIGFDHLKVQRNRAWLFSHMLHPDVISLLPAVPLSITVSETVSLFLRLCYGWRLPKCSYVIHVRYVHRLEKERYVSFGCSRNSSGDLWTFQTVAKPQRNSLSIQKAHNSLSQVCAHNVRE